MTGAGDLYAFHCCLLMFRSFARSLHVMPQYPSLETPSATRPSLYRILCAARLHGYFLVIDIILIVYSLFNAIHETLFHVLDIHALMTSVGLLFAAIGRRVHLALVMDYFLHFQLVNDEIIDVRCKF